MSISKYYPDGKTVTPKHNCWTEDNM